MLRALKKEAAVQIWGEVKMVQEEDGRRQLECRQPLQIRFLSGEQRLLRHVQGRHRSGGSIGEIMS